MPLNRLTLLLTLLAVATGLHAEEKKPLDLTPPGGRNAYPELPEIKDYKPISAQDEIEVVDLEYGVFQNRITLDAAEADRNSDLDEFDIALMDYKEREPITETAFVPAKVGVKFGVRYKLDGPGAKRAVRVKLLYITPGLKNPKTGAHMDKIELEQELNPRSRYYLMAFQFAEAWEVSPGAWHMYVFQGDRKLVHKTFTVVR